jgi:MFS family permease
MMALMLGPSAILLLSFGTFMRALHAEFGWSIPAISIGASIIALTIVLVSPVQGWLIDRLGARAVVLGSAPVWGLGLILMAFLPARIDVFYLACFLLTVAASGLLPPSFMQVVTTWFDRHMGLAMGAINLAPGLAATALPFLLTFAFERVGWRGGYAILGAAVLLLLWPTAAIWLRQGPKGRTDEAGHPPVGLPYAEAARTRVFWLTGYIFLVLGMISTGLVVNQIAILMDAGVPGDRAVSIQAAIGLGSVFARLATGWLLDRVSVRAVGMLTCGIAAAACLVLVSPAAPRYAIGASVAVGLVIGAEFDVLGVLVRRYHGFVAFGRIFGTTFSAFQLGGAIGAAGLGISRVQTGSYTPALVAFAGLILIGAALFPLFGDYRFTVEDSTRSKNNL